jgi:hypothetical protein
MKYYLFIPIFFLLFISCYSKRYIDIQVLTPALIQVPRINTLIVEDERSTIVLLNRKDSSQTRYYNIILRAFYNSLKENLKESPAFENTQILLLNSHDVRDYTNTKENTYILKCRFKLKVDTTYNQYMLDWSNFGIYVNYYKFYFQLSCLNDSTMADLNQISDVYVYAKKNSQENELTGISELAKLCADKYYTRLAPHWLTVERMLFYAPNKLMRKGYNSLCVNNLEESLTYWKKVTEVGTPPLASKAAHNLGLIYEMQDKLDTSEYYLTESLKKKFDPLTKSYLDTIRSRKLTRINLEKQIQ